MKRILALALLAAPLALLGEVQPREFSVVNHSGSVVGFRCFDRIIKSPEVFARERQTDTRPPLALIFVPRDAFVAGRITDAALLVVGVLERRSKSQIRATAVESIAILVIDHAGCLRYAKNVSVQSDRCGISGLSEAISDTPVFAFPEMNSPTVQHAPVIIGGIN